MRVTALLKRMDERAARHPVWVVLVVMWTMVLTVAGDVVTGADLVFTPLYFVPIAMGGWFHGRRLALLCAVSATATWFIVDLEGHARRPLGLHLWNLIVQAFIFLTIAFLVPALRSALSTERTGRADAERDLEHAQRLTTVGKMAAGIAHELGTPLNVAGSYSRMIRDGALVGEEAKKSAGIVEAQIQFMTDIIRQMLDFARAQEPRRTEQSLNDLASAMVSLLAPVVRQRHVELTFNPSPDLPLVSLDSGQMRQVFSNLTINAVQASRDGGRVEVTVAEASRTAPLDLETDTVNWLVFSVRDEGSGIAPAVLPRIFDPFFTTKPVGEGTGLGLAVAWGIVRKHGGWIGVESTEGKGSCFSVYLPRSGAAPRKTR